MIEVVCDSGTRPEGIEMVSAVHKLARRPGSFESMVFITARRRRVLDRALNVFGISPTWRPDSRGRERGLPTGRLLSLAIAECDAVHHVYPAHVELQVHGPDYWMRRGAPNVTLLSPLDYQMLV